MLKRATASLAVVFSAGINHTMDFPNTTDFDQSKYIHATVTEFPVVKKLIRCPYKCQLTINFNRFKNNPLISSACCWVRNITFCDMLKRYILPWLYWNKILPGKM